jgi:hypothetical protein
MRWIYALVLSGALGLGCAMTTEPAGTVNTALIATDAPPKAKTDTQKASPGEGYFWVKGHWAWKQEQWKWINGHWEKQRPGYSWVEPRYEVQSGQHMYVLGGWVPQNTAPVGNTGGATKENKTP